jgi:hypothetical protein
MVEVLISQSPLDWDTRDVIYTPIGLGYRVFNNVKIREQFVTFVYLFIVLRSSSGVKA